jgi:hypothetical protein
MKFSVVKWAKCQRQMKSPSFSQQKGNGASINSQSNVVFHAFLTTAKLKSSPWVGRAEVWRRFLSGI